MDCFVDISRKLSFSFDVLLLKYLAQVKILFW